MSQAIGILGGTFDPVHVGHLRLALEAYRQLDLREVRLIPVYTPPHRGTPEATPAQRLTMLQLAAAQIGGLIVDDSEITRRVTSYTVDTLRNLRALYPQQPLCLIIGMDQFQILDTWRDWNSVPEYAHLIIVERPGSQAAPGPSQARLLRERLIQDRAALTDATTGAILKLQAPLLEISATYIRNLVRTGASIKYLTPDPVIDYIERERLYK